jgi:hypothetical protein
LGDGADYGSQDAEGGATDEDPASPKDIRDATDDGKGYGRGEGVGECYPGYVRVLVEVSTLSFSMIQAC